MAYSPEQTKATADLLAKGNALGSAASKMTGVQFNPGMTQPQVPETPITSESLQPAQTLSIPPSPTSTQTGALQGYFEQLSSRTQETKTGADNSLQSVINTLVNSDGESSLTSQAYSQDGGVDDLQSELNDINAQMMAEQHALRREIQRIEANDEGLFGGAVRDRVNEVTRQSLSKQADLAVVQMAKQGRYDSAKQIADRAVSAQLERQRQEKEIRMFIYQENKEMFTKAEQREFEAREKERDRELENEEYRLRSQFDAKIKQADPLYQTQLAKARFDLDAARQAMFADALPTPGSTLQLSKQQSQINTLQSLSKSPGLNSSVGPTFLTRSAVADKFGAKDRFIGDVEQLRSQLNLDTLIQAKGSGATFGALSDQELRILGTAATTLGQWAKTDKSGKVTGYDVDEASFRAELDKINNFAKLDYVLKGGDPAEIGVQILPDGTMWTRNSDGNLTQLQ